MVQGAGRVEQKQVSETGHRVNTGYYPLATVTGCDSLKDIT